ncbi:hypothetical protein AGABI2DRAFT_201173, partial [Agaricus bisporus var. bisporus H97]|uniref:hypothetical protein n=1 Tax=Agaricus bisporus var. bisporus (strain H97 / ATCC MYA-4626 / FGSC 10389) TaxID=936046 RepID=UPI00029F672D
MIPILDVFAEAGSSGFFSSPENQEKYQLGRLSQKPSSTQWAPIARQFEAEITFSTIFFSWCRHSSDSSILDKLASEGNIKPDVLATLRHLGTVAVRRPAEEFPFTRRIQRKVIMHVGPTNSGKTHHALRALAAAKTGVYAGPLRLLAHEIWERLNLDSRPSTNSKYARATNMITGEEKKVVEHYAGLLSCTIEMLSSRMEYDVGVIDEIQMIGDPQRGFAWTSAVLGLSARELHLCGEASAIPIVQSLLQETGDDLEIRQYERLTPLLVEEESLGGDLSKVQKGDCVIAFSRTSIFALKTEIEKKSGLKCAVVYGKLPPEIRSEQAALFNDPDSGFDVIIGSDAIGMGLNLKIRRIIFSAVTKGDGASSSKVPLSISQTKQIAGRAGRYGHSIDPSNSCGYVTTLHPKDLPFVKDALSHPSTPTLSHAYVGPTVESMEA